MKDLKTLLEASLMDINSTIEDGNKYNNVDLEMLMNAKSESEFNVIYDILKDKIENTQKKPKNLISDSGYKYPETKPGEYYIVFYTREMYGEDVKTVFFGNEETASFSWTKFSERRHKPETSWSTFKFEHANNDLWDKEIRVLPKEWSNQISKILKKLGK